MIFFLSSLSLISIIGIGSIFADSRLPRLVLGLGISSLFVTPLLYINVSLVRPAQLVIFVIGLILCANLIAKSTKNNHFRELLGKTSIQQILVFGVYTAGALYFLGQFSSKEYVYESHDVLYLGWLQEIWIRDYSGSLRVPTMWPEAMGVANNLPGMVIGQVAVLEPTMNLEVAIQVKFTLLVIALLCGPKFRKGLDLMKLLGALGGLGLCLILYSGEIGTSLLLSSFWYVIVLLTLLAGLIKVFTLDYTTIILLVILLLAAKSQLVLLPVLMLLLLYKWDHSNFKNWKVVLFLVGLVANIIVWVSGPKSSGGDLGFPTILDIRPRRVGEGWQIDFSGILNSNSALVDWYSGLEMQSIKAVIDSGSEFWIAVILLIVKIYLPYYFLRKKLQINIKHLMLIDLYMLSSLFSWLLIRNGGHAGHQAHAFLLAPLVTSSFILGYTIQNAKKIQLYSMIGLAALPINLFLGNIPFAKNLSNLKTQEVSSVRNSEPQIQIQGEIVPIAKKQVIFSIAGKRLSYNPEGNYKGSQVANFTVGR